MPGTSLWTFWYLVASCLPVITATSVASSSIPDNDALLSICPVGYTEYFRSKNTCYKKYEHSWGRNWTEAQAWCQQKGGSLPIVHDSETNSHIQHLASIWEFESIWLGLVKLSDLSVFRWLDGNPVGFSHWEADQPSASADQTLDCVKYNTSGIFTWVGVDCSSIENFVCERRSEVTPLCASGYALNDERLTCIKINKGEAVTWKNARQACAQEGGDLVVIPDAASGDFVDGLITDVNIEYWVGLNSSRVVLDYFMSGAKTPMATTDFAWVDGSRLDYQNWKVGYPIDLAVNFTCATATPRGLELSNHFCREEKSFICEKRVDWPLFCSGNGWIMNPENKRCYTVSTELLNWNASRLQCQKHGGDLAVYRDSFTDKYLRDLARTKYSDSRRMQFWIGLYIPVGKENYEWIDGSAFNKLLVYSSYYNSSQCASMYNYYYLRAFCYSRSRFICEKASTIDYPVLECPQGYTTYITTTEQRVVCLMAERRTPMAYHDARQECQSTGGYLYTFLFPEEDMRVFVINNLLGAGKWYWASGFGCEIFSSTLDMKYAACTEEHHFVCRHQGIVRSVFNVRKTVLEYDRLLFIGDDFLQDTNDLWLAGDDTSPDIVLISEVCNYFTRLDLANVRNWKLTNNTISAVGRFTVDADMDLGKQTECIGLPSQIPECCAEMIVNGSNYLPETQAAMDIEFPAENVFCLCPEALSTTVAGRTTPPMNTTTPLKPTTTPPTTTTTQLITTSSMKTEPMPNATTANTPDTHTTPPPPPPPPPQDPAPMTQETVKTLRTLTTLQNTNASNPPSKLCPCRCDKVKFDLNPSSEALSKILSKFKKDLEVNTEALSTKRRKKVSAQDNRAESQTIGYISVMLCSIPFWVIIGADMLRLYQYLIEKKRNKNVLNGDKDRDQNIDASKDDTVEPPQADHSTP